VEEPGNARRLLWRPMHWPHARPLHQWRGKQPQEAAGRCAAAAASILGREWFRRYIRLALTEPGATIGFNSNQRSAAAQALAVLLPGSLPKSFLDSFPSERRAGAEALRGILSSIEDLEASFSYLVKAVLGAMTQFNAATQADSRTLPIHAVERAVAASLTA